MKFLSLLIFSLVLNSCLNSESKSSNSKNNSQKEDNKTTSNNSILLTPPIPDTHENKIQKFVFIKLVVTQVEFDPNKMGTPTPQVDVRYNFCTEIQQLSNIDEDTKYKLMDEAQLVYSKTSSAKSKNGRVNSRQCLVFDSYAEASKARETYITNE